MTIESGPNSYLKNAIDYISNNSYREIADLIIEDMVKTPNLSLDYKVRMLTQELPKYLTAYFKTTEEEIGTKLASIIKESPSFEEGCDDAIKFLTKSIASYKMSPSKN